MSISSWVDAVSERIVEKTKGFIGTRIRELFLSVVMIIWMIMVATVFVAKLVR